MNSQTDVTPTRSRGTRWPIWIGLIIAAGVLVVFRLHAFPAPLETDECNYAYIGGRLLAGDRLYVDVWDHQPPGVFVLFAGVIALFGDGEAVFRWLATGFSLASMGLVFQLVSRRVGDAAGVFAAIAFAIVSSDPGTAGDGCNREIYMNTLTLGALAVLTGGPMATNRRLLIAGMLLGVASTLKTVVAPIWVALLIWSLYNRRLPDRSARYAIRIVLYLAAGPALFWMGIGGYFAATGRWEAFVDAVFRFNVGYAGADTRGHLRIGEFFDPIFPVFASALPLWLATIAVFVVLAKSVRKTPAGIECAWVCYLLACFFAVVMPGRFWPHYYYLMIAPMVVGCGLLWIGAPLARPAAWVVGLGWLVALAAFQYRYYLGVDVAQFAAGRYDYRDQWARAQGRRVAELTEPNDTVFIWGKDAGIYYYANRRCASRYTMIGALERGAVGFESRREVLLNELENSRPRMMLFVEPGFEFLMPLLDTYYAPAGIDGDDRDPTRPILLVWALRDRPVRDVPWEWIAPRRVK
ncbi:MAG: hypothetical protein HOP29_05830 [Phycisphaerales bacterium]|nr:hypothetical protein [Phycisphaerales bacterium]